MSKHREALRRGIRSLIHDTSRELADLEGREMPAEVDAEDVPSNPGPHSFAEEAASAEGGPMHAEVAEVEVREAPAHIPESMTPDLEPPAVAQEARAVEEPKAEVPQAPPDDEAPLPPMAGRFDERPSDGLLDVQRAGAAAEPASAREDAIPDVATAGPAAPSAAGPAWPDERPSEGPGHAAPPPVKGVGPAPASEPIWAEAAAAEAAPVAADTASPGERPSDKPGEAVPPSVARVESAPPSEQVVPEAVTAAAARPARRRRARRGSKRTARRETAPMPAADALDGIDPAQAQSRKGVCVAYFVDHACWHIPNAYCNTALHMCVRRNCPVYHLHQVALERRFASKYRHFW